MHTIDGLIDIHARAHRTMKGVMEHCRAVEAEKGDVALTGFAYPTLREQVHHVLGAERYWLSVLHGQIELDDDLATWPDMAALMTMREQVAEVTAKYIRGAGEAVLTTAQELNVYGGRDEQVEPPRVITRSVSIVPARVILRVSTHIYDHKGQISVMCRQLGHPVPAGLDFPLL